MRKEHKVFKGSAYVLSGRSDWTKVGWARISVLRDGEEPVFTGGFEIRGDSHHILTGKKYKQTRIPGDPDVVVDKSDDSYMVVYRDSDTIRHDDPTNELKRRDVVGDTGCSSDALGFNNDFKLQARRTTPNLAYASLGRLFGRQTDTLGNTGAGVSLADNIGSTTGCPTTRKIALMGVATDCTYTGDFESESDMRSNLIDQFNLASEVYERQFDISLGIRNLTVSSEECPTSDQTDEPWNQACSANIDIVDRLNLFSAWRGTLGDDNAFWTLMSTCNTDSAVGLAWLGQVCVTTSSATGDTGETVSGTNVVIRTDKEWQVIAHEIGHTFGAVHDCESDACAQGLDDSQSCCPLTADTCSAVGGFIMNPSTSDGITSFSECTVGNICSAMDQQQIRTDCLADNLNVVTIQESQCGNGIVEEGEECDCGGVDTCGDNACCDAETCQFIGDAVCDPDNAECCTDSCQLASAGSVCRESTGACDPEETCPGDTAMCPTNLNSNDGDECGDGLTCASGVCTSRDEQCLQRLSPNSENGEVEACDDDSSCSMCCLFVGNSTQTFPRQSYIDGTPCSGGGTCSSGLCTNGNIVEEITDFWDENKNILLPVLCVIGGLIALGILWSCFSCIWRRMRMARNKRKNREKISSQMDNGEWSAYGGAWGQENSRYYAPPAAPPRSAAGTMPPSYTQSQEQFGNYPPNGWTPPRRQSTLRYA